MSQSFMYKYECKRLGGNELDLAVLSESTTKTSRAITEKFFRHNIALKICFWSSSLVIFAKQQKFFINHKKNFVDSSTKIKIL